MIATLDRPQFKGISRVISAKTIEVIGTQYSRVRHREPNEFFALTGNDLNDLACLAVRLNGTGARLEGDELRDWENRLWLMLTNAVTVT